MIGLHQRASHSCSRGMTASPYTSSRPAFDLRTSAAVPAPGLEERRAELLGLVHRGQPLVAVGLVLLGRVDDPVGLDERLGGPQPGVLAPHLVGGRAMSLVDVDLEWPWVIHSATARPTPGPP